MAAVLAAEGVTMSRSLPAFFIGHGNPMNALATNAYTRAWSAIGQEVRRPRGVVSVSAHWFVPGTSVTAMQNPRTIHDFGGFPRELYEVRYSAPGDPALAARVADALAPIPVGRDERWGLDHGTWSVLVHVFPDADIPVVQLSIDETQPPEFHFEVGKRLAPLRDEGILLIGSGNIVHNLEAYAWGGRPVNPFAWTARFETLARELLVTGEDGPLVDYENLEGAQLAIPTPEHYLPLLYVMGARRPGESVRFPVEGVDGGSVSMLAVQFGEL